MMTMPNTLTESEKELVQQALDEMVAKGIAYISGYTEDGQALYTLTENKEAN